MTTLRHRNLLIYDKNTTKLRRVYKNFMIILQCFVNWAQVYQPGAVRSLSIFITGVSYRHVLVFVLRGE